MTLAVPRASKATVVPPKETSHKRGASMACGGLCAGMEPRSSQRQQGLPMPPGALSPRSSGASGAGGRPRPLAEQRREELHPPMHPLCRALRHPGSHLRVLR